MLPVARRQSWLKKASAIAFVIVMQHSLAPLQASEIVVDPYIWLEKVSSPQTVSWVEAENARTVATFESDPRYTEFFAEALKIVEATDRIPMPDVLVGNEVTNFWQDANHVRGIWRATALADYRSAAPHWRTLIDFDALSTSSNASYVWKESICEPRAQQRCLIAISAGGEDATSLREFDMRTGLFVAAGFDLPVSKQDVAWETTSSLLVARDWGPGTMTSSGYPFVIKRLRRGQPLNAAEEVYRGKPSDVRIRPFAYVDGDGNHVCGVLRATTFFDFEVYLMGKSGLIKVDAPSQVTLVGLNSGYLIFTTAAPWSVSGRPAIPAGSIVALDATSVTRGKQAVPEVVFAPSARQAVDVDEVKVTRNAVLAAIYDNVRGRGYSFTRHAGAWQAKLLSLPENASVKVVAANPAIGTAYVSIASFLTPTSIWQVDTKSGNTTKIKGLEPRFDASGLVTEQLEAVSKDGTRVPYFITRRIDTKLDGSTPTILTAYGGFQLSNTPTYRDTVGKLWLERGGAFVVANIRGGGEFGPAWHQAALKTKRQVAYDDFAAVGEDLIARKITSPRRLGISGGSNGGLLVAVGMLQRPELWSAVQIDVPLLDMLRIEHIAAGASWTGEYGSVSNADELAFWEKTSPYHLLKRGGAYPMPYIFTTTKDDRVGPGHARKFAARMKEYELPYFYYENTEGGHAAGANLKQKGRSSAFGMIYFTRALMDPATEP